MLRICIVGGVFGARDEVRAVLRGSPEIILAGGLARCGHVVTTAGHNEVLDCERYDLVHVHHFGRGAMQMACSNGVVPFVFTSHDGASMCGLTPDLVRRRAIGIAMARADAVVALSEPEARYQRKNYNLDSAAHEVIPNGIDPSSFPYVRRNAAGKGAAWQLLYVGQLIELKGVDVLLRSMSLLPGSVHLMLVYHTNAREESLRQLAASLSLSERVHFAGPKEPAELARIYQSADILVLPSRAEALPSVITEALLSGLPVVASSVGGIPDQLRDYGELVPPGNAAALALAITNTMNNYSQQITRSALGRAYGAERFAVETMISAHLRLYTRVIGCTSARRARNPIKRTVNRALRTALHLVA